MERIASFCVDHNKLKKGMYISRTDGDIVTYDIRMCIPNGGVYLTNGAMHTFEHLFATYVRNSEFSNNIIYVGPMGCRTGFYLLVRSMENSDVIALTLKCFEFIRDFEGTIPGSTAAECGNYKEHDLPGAKKTAEDMLNVLRDWTVPMLSYEYHNK